VNGTSRSGIVNRPVAATWRSTVRGRPLIGQHQRHEPVASRLGLTENFRLLVAGHLERFAFK
jgi:hypothetical protein